MTNVIPFTPRGSAEGGWTAAERARLAELAERLSAAEGVKVEAVYGVSDEGDPWCVIKDENEEVLIHVARIDGQFVIHDAAADAIQEEDSLWSACDRLLGEAWRDPREDVVVSLNHRQAQSVIALALAVAFIHEVQQAEAAVDPDAASALEADADLALTASVAAAPQVGDEPRPELLAAPAPGERGGASAAPAETAPADEPQAPAAPTPSSDPSAGGSDSPAADIAAVELVDAAQDEPAVLLGTDGADTLQGGDGAETIFGGAGDDSLNGGGGADELRGGSGADTLDGGGAGGAGFDVLDGGEGDDVIALAGDAAAWGGEGADSFVIGPPRPAPDGSGLLGVILDFHEEEGDRLVFQFGRPVDPPPDPPVISLETAPGFGPTTSSQGFNGRQVFVDYDNDGVADGHILIADKVQPDGSSAAVVVGQETWGHDASAGDYGFAPLPDGYIVG